MINKWRCQLCFLTPGGVPETTTETFCNSWKNHGKSIHGKSMENRMEQPWKNHGNCHGESMENQWVIKTEKRTFFRGTPWGPHGFPWVPMGPHGTPWDPMGSPWGPHGLPWKIQECRKSWILKIPQFGKTEWWKHGVQFDAQYVSAPSCHVKTA